jgi:stress-induced morphogen
MAESTESRVVTAEELEATIRKNLPCEFVRAVDESSGCGAKFAIEIVSESFRGKMPLACHRMMHKVLEEEIKHIHAVTFKTRVPAKVDTAEVAVAEAEASGLTESS